MKYFAVVSLVFASLSFTALATENIPYKTLLNKAQKHYEQQHYQAALADFKASYQLEPLDSTLYNIAICHYKLQQWQFALATFQTLKETQPDNELIDYNIAINQKKLGQLTIAKETFSYLSAYAEDENIALLADQQLLALTAPDTQQPTSTKNGLWQNLLNIQLGNENNIVLPDGENFSEQSDQFVDYLFASSWTSSEDLSNAWLLDFTYYGSKYSQAKSYEISMYSLAARKYISPTSLDNTRFYIGLSYNSISIANDDYIDNSSIQLGWQYNASNIQQYSAMVSRYRTKTCFCNKRHLSLFSWQLKQHATNLKTLHQEWLLEIRRKITN